MRGLVVSLVVLLACDDDVENACERIVDLAEEDAIFIDTSVCERDMSDELPSCANRERYLECLDEVPSYRGARLCEQRLCD